MAAIEVEVPIEVEILMTAQAPEFLRLLAQVPLHLCQRLGGIDHRIAAMPFHGLDLLEHLNEFLGFVADQARITEAEIARSQVRQRIAESAALEPKFAQENRQFVVIVDQFAGGDTGCGLNAQSCEDFISPFDFAANVRQSAVFLMPGNIMRINGHDHAA